MSGQRTQIIPKTAYSFSTGAGTTTTITLGPRTLDSEDWRSARMLVNLVSASGPSTNTFSVKVLNATVTPEDSNTLFVSSTALATASFTSLTTAPSELTQTVSGGMVDKVTVQLEVVSSVSGTMACTLSVELEGRLR